MLHPKDFKRLAAGGEIFAAKPSKRQPAKE